MFGRKVEDVAMLAKVLIKKDKFDPATIHYSTENILTETKKGPLFEPKFIFYKTDHWKIVDKKSQSEIMNMSNTDLQSIGISFRKAEYIKNVFRFFKNKTIDFDKMSDKEYAKNQEAIMEALRTGKFVYDLSGAAR